MRDIRKPYIIPYVSYVLSFAVFSYACFSLYKIITTSAPDFGVYYGATKELAAGVNPYAGSALYTGFGYPPFTSVMFLPFLMLPQHAAQGLFIILSAISIPLIAWILLILFKDKQIKAYDIVLWSSLFFLLFPTRFTLGMGQSNLISLALVCGSLIFLKRGKNVAGSLLFGLAMSLKPHLILLLPFILLGGEFAFAACAAGVVLGMGIVSIVFFGWERYIQYYHDMVVTLLPYSGRGIYYNQGFAGFFARALPQSAASVLTTVSSILLYAVSLMVIVKNRMKLPYIIALGLCVMVLVEPLSWQHHAVFLLPAYVAIYPMVRQSKASTFLFICSLLLVGYNIRQPEMFAAMGIGPYLLSHGFAGTALITGLMVSSVRMRQI